MRALAQLIMTEHTIQPIQIEYKFTLAKGDEKTFKISLDPASLNLIADKHVTYPEWTKLNYEKCSNCPLDPAQHASCPVAINIFEMVSSFKDLTSYDEVDVTVVTDERSYFKRLPLQKGLSGLLGIYMTTNACPIMGYMKPMVRFHLPFATPFETMQRTLSSYLLAQYLRKRRGEKTDWSFKKLRAMYDEIRIVNKAMHKRLRAVGEGDANLNAIICLDVFAMQTSYLLDADALQELEGLYKTYFDQ